jgi:uncharacterized metal-binding protein (TIGR02443 family)
MKKRFIAGVVCPKCGAADSVRTHIAEAGEEDYQVRDCVECGYEESLAGYLKSKQELPTRVNQAAKPAVEEVEPQVLKVL